MQNYGPDKLIEITQILIYLRNSKIKFVLKISRLPKIKTLIFF